MSFDPGTGFSLARLGLAIMGLFRPAPRNAERDRAAALFRDEMQRLRESFLPPGVSGAEPLADPISIEARRAVTDVQRAVARFREFLPDGVQRDGLLAAERDFLDYLHETFGQSFDSALLPFASVANEDEVRATLAGYVDRLRDFAAH